MAATNLRGQLGVKSGPLAPTSAKLTTQMLVVSHMNNHYNKISKAKHAIDNGPPKSMLSSQKLRDRKCRKFIETHGSRPASSLTHRYQEEDIYDEQQWEEPMDDEERQVRDIMRTTLRVPLRAQHDSASNQATAGSTGTEHRSPGLRSSARPHSASMRGLTPAMQAAVSMGRPRPLSARSTTSLASNLSGTSRCTNPLKATYDGDVLHKHAHSFTEPAKPFTPRTLKSNRESSLKRYKYYTPPPPKRPQGAEREAATDRDETSVKAPAAAAVPKAKPRGGSAKASGDLGATETLTETMLMDMSLQSHDPRQRSDGGGNVPRLDISMDKDHMNWVQEQATRAHIRSAARPIRNGHGEGEASREQLGGTGDSDTLRFTRTASTVKSFGGKSPTSLRLGQAEEEQKYVAFAREVTQDIASRGISSDRVVQQLFDKHIDRNKDKLDERRLRAIITDIRRDLGVQDVGPLQTKSRSSKAVPEDESAPQTSTTTVSFQERSTRPGSEFDQSKEGLAGDTMKSGSSTMSTVNNTFNFDRTTDVFSTIHSQGDLEEEGEDLSATQALKQYQMNITVKDRAEEDQGFGEGLESTLTTNNGEEPRSADATREEEGVEEAREESSMATEESRPSPNPRPRRLTRQDASTAGQGETSRQASLSETEAKTEEEVEEEEEEYEDDYDADEDGTQQASDDDF